MRHMTCCSNGPSLNLMLSIFAGICGVQTEEQSHRNTHTPSAGLRLTLQDNRSEEAPTTSCSEGQRSQSGFITPKSQVRLQDNPLTLQTHLNLNFFQIITLKVAFVLRPEKSVIIKLLLSSRMRLSLSLALLAGLSPPAL